MSASWHLGPDLADRYVDGRLDPVLAASVEQHLLDCADCRALLAPTVDRSRLDRVLAEVVESVQAPAPRLLERLLLRVGVDDDTARLLAVTPALRAAWLLGVTTVLVLALGAADLSPRGAALFLALAPVLPVVGVALSFGRSTDPAHEVVAVTPYPALRLLAVRTALVVATTLLPTSLAAVLLPGTTWLAVAWLLPSFGLTAATLALSTRISPEVAGATLAVLWTGLVLPAAFVHSAAGLVLSPWLQVIGGVALVAGAVVLLTRGREVPDAIWRAS